MALLEILTYPNSILKKPTKPVKEIDDEIHELVEDMAETMFAAPGVGLAANQVGIDKSIIVYNPGPFTENDETKKFHCSQKKQKPYNKGENNEA